MTMMMQWSQALLTKVHAALPPGGTLLIAEPMAGTPGAEAMGDAYFGLYLWAMGSGRPRTAEAYRAMLRAAGFSRVVEAAHRRADGDKAAAGLALNAGVSDPVAALDNRMCPKIFDAEKRQASFTSAFDGIGCD